MSKRARTSFRSPEFRVREGDVFSDDAPQVKAAPDLFEDVDDHIERLERATANPGELRNTPIRTAEKKKPAKRK